MTRGDLTIEKEISGRVMEAGGPEGMSYHAKTSKCLTHPTSVLTFRMLMELVLEYNLRYRAIISLPVFVGMLQARFLERLPTNLFTITRDQVRGDHLPFKLVQV